MLLLLERVNIELLNELKILILGMVVMEISLRT
jgi:hypothetical protein